MAEVRMVADSAAKDPPYVGIQGEMLAEAALGRVPELQAKPAGDDQPYTYIVTTKQGAKFFVLVQAFSSVRREWNEKMAQWPWDIDADVVRHARGIETPVVLFVFDADSGQGRFAEVSSLPDPATATTERITASLPDTQIVSDANLAALGAKLGA